MERYSIHVYASEHCSTVHVVTPGKAKDKKTQKKTLKMSQESFILSSSDHS